MSVQIQLRNDTSTNWESVNPVLAQGELGLERDTRKFKIGNGTDNWNDLPYNVNDVQTFLEVDNGLYNLNNIGIGTTNPTSKLTVYGNAEVSGTLSAESLNIADLTSVIGYGTLSISTSISIGSTSVVNVTLPKTCILNSVGCSGTSWIRIYNSDSASASDESRSIETDPGTGSGVIVEVRTVGIQTINLSPTPTLSSNQIPRSNSYPIRITNQSLNSNLNISVSYVKLEQ